MTTVSDIVTRSHRKIRVVASDEQMTGDQSVNGLDALNMMLAQWKLRGVDISHTTLTLADDFPLDAEFEEGTVYLLASRLSNDYSRPQDFDADDFFRAIQAAYIVMPTMTIDPTLLSRRNIAT